jgi:hypothetical protein
MFNNPHLYGQRNQVAFSMIVFINSEEPLAHQVGNNNIWPSIWARTYSTTSVEALASHDDQNITDLLTVTIPSFKTKHVQQAQASRSPATGSAFLRLWRHG